MKDGRDYLLWIRGFLDCAESIYGSGYSLDSAQIRTIREKAEEHYCWMIEGGTV